MLRSSNVRSLWTGTRTTVGIGRCGAMRRFYSHAGVRAFRSGLVVPVQSGRSMLGGGGPGDVRGGIVHRWYTTEERPQPAPESNLELESAMRPERGPDSIRKADADADADEEPEPELEPPGESSPEENPAQPTALDIAKAGTSSKEQKPEYGTTRGLLTTNQLRRELRWLADPRALADRVARLLAEKDLASAAAMTRMARIPSVVAWNHLMEYCMKEGEALAAFRFYNDVCLPLLFLFFSFSTVRGADWVDEKTRQKAEFADLHDYVEGI